MFIKERDFLDLPANLRPQNFPKASIYGAGVLDDGRAYTLAQVPHGSQVCLKPTDCLGIIRVPMIQGQRGILNNRACGKCQEKVEIDLLVLKMELKLPLL